MSDYKLKTGKIGEAVIGAAKNMEEKFTEKFLEKNEGSPAGYSLKTGGMTGKATAAYQKIEDTVTGGYKKIEDTVVGGYKKIEDRFVETFLEKEENREVTNNTGETEEK